MTDLSITLAFGAFGVPELLIILACVLLVFGAGKLPGIGDALGRSIKNFKRSVKGNDELEVNERAHVDKIESPAEKRQLGDVKDAEVVSKEG